MENLETEKQLIEIIRAALHGKKVNIDSLSNEIGNLAKRNKVFNLLYLGTGNEKAKKKYKEFLIQEAAQAAILHRMTVLFEENGVYLMPIKGAQTKKRYPKPELRAMNDIDVLCKPEQHKRVRELMKTIGYDEYRQGRKHEAYFIAPYVTVEVHYDLVDGESSYYDYYRNIWDRLTPARGCCYVYEMSLEDEYIFNLVHLAVHFLEGGAGMRFFADVYVYEALAFDTEYVVVQLTKLDLLRFRENCKQLALYWFGTKEQRQKTVITPVLEQMEAYVLTGGLFGDQSRKQDMSVSAGRLKTLKRNFFPNYYSMKSMYSWLRPPLLPAAWGMRAIHALGKRRDNVTGVLKTVYVGNKDDGIKIEKFYKQCGLSAKE